MPVLGDLRVGSRRDELFFGSALWHGHCFMLKSSVRSFG